MKPETDSPVPCKQGFQGKGGDVVLSGLYPIFMCQTVFYMPEGKNGQEGDIRKPEGIIWRLGGGKEDGSRSSCNLKGSQCKDA